MNLRSLIFIALLMVAAFSLAVSCVGFTSGNILAVKADLSSNSTANSPLPSTDQRCTPGYITEFNRNGEIVQEIALPTEEVNGTHPCLLFSLDDYNGRLTVSNDGYRAIMPCCNYVNETDSYLTSFAVIYGNGVIQTTAPFDANNGTVKYLYNAVLDGEDVWFTTPGAIYYTTLTSNTSTLVFSGDVLTIRSYEGNLFASNYENLNVAVVQIGEGLPKTQVNFTVFLDQNWDTDAFEFSENYLTVGNYDPKGLYVLNKTTHDIIYSNDVFGEVVQLVIFEDNNTILAHVNRPQELAKIYKFTFNDEIGLPNGTIWRDVDDDATSYYFFGLIKAPRDSCQDNVTNFDETDVDCGGSLCSARCVDGKACSLASDCSSNVCTNGVCVLPTPTSTPTSSQKTPTAATSSANELIPMIMLCLVMVITTLL